MSGRSNECKSRSHHDGDDGDDDDGGGDDARKVAGQRGNSGDGDGGDDGGGTARPVLRPVPLPLRCARRQSLTHSVHPESAPVGRDDWSVVCSV